jgi:methionyl aminopeptidase
LKDSDVNDTQGRVTREGIRIYQDADFAGMRAAGKVAAQILDEVGPLVQPGITTESLDDFIAARVRELGATSATIGYTPPGREPYRHASCISVNHVVCHGIPSDKLLKDGDILNIDVTVIVDGWFGDTSRMYVAGKPSVKAKRLIEVTHDALMKGIEAVKPGNSFGDIGHAIQAYVEAHRMSVVRDFCGHGLGRVFHAPPNVLHYGRPGAGPRLEEGMFFTIEPMVNLGRHETKELSDGWTAVTRDKSRFSPFLLPGCSIPSGNKARGAGRAPVAVGAQLVVSGKRVTTMSAFSGWIGVPSSVV